ncbi:MAG: hypothetical protein HYV63_24710 [Candidatus Schekmanbacteria bacterium]|nr:hypothetical protein [Candidatus Schekmanbacteria bacterium]
MSENEYDPWLRRRADLELGWDECGQLVVTHRTVGHRERVTPVELQMIGVFQVAKPLSRALAAVPPEQRSALRRFIMNLVERGHIVEDGAAGELDGAPGPRFAELPLRATAAAHLEQSAAELRARLFDSAYLAAYRAALTEAVPAGATAVIAGCGTGLLAQLALQAGAGRVYAVESAATRAVVTQVAAANGLAERIVVISPATGALPEDARAAVFVAASAGRAAWDAGLPALLEHARQHWMCECPVVVPSSLTLLAAPVWIPWFEWRLRDAWGCRPYGLDLSPLRSDAATTAYAAKLSEAWYAARPAALWTGELGAGAVDELPAGTAALGITATAPAINGVALFARLLLSPNVTLDTRASVSTDEVFLPLASLCPVDRYELLQIAVRFGRGRGDGVSDDGGETGGPPCWHLTATVEDDPTRTFQTAARFRPWLEDAGN